MRVHLYFLLISLIAIPIYAEESSKWLGVAVGVFGETDTGQGGAEIALVTDISHHISGRVSALMYLVDGEGDNLDNFDKLFGGYAVAGYYHANFNYINPQIGMGIFHGETFSCTEYAEKQGTCEEHHTFALYPEAGITVTISKLFIYPFVRRYFDIRRQGKIVNLYGIQVGINF